MDNHLTLLHFTPKKDFSVHYSQLKTHVFGVSLCFQILTFLLVHYIDKNQCDYWMQNHLLFCLIQICRPFQLKVINLLTLWKIMMFTDSPTNTPSSPSKVYSRSPWFSPCAPSSKSWRNSPQLSNNYQSPGHIPLSPIWCLLVKPCKAVKQRKRYSISEKLHFLCKIDGILSKNPDLYLHWVAKVFKVPVSLMPKWMKQYDSFFLLSRCSFWLQLKNNCSKKFSA